MSRIKPPSPALVVACLALVIALGPAVKAANTVFSTDIVDGEVKTADLAEFAVTGNNIAANSVGGSNVIDASLTNADLADLAVSHAKLGKDSVGSNNVVDNSLTGADLKGANGFAVVSLAAGAVANGRCKDLNVSASRASVGEAVLVSLTRAVPVGMVFYGVMVPSANHVILKVCNLTGGASPAISGLPLRVFTFG